DRLALGCRDLDAVATQHDDLAVLDVLDATGVGQEGGHGRGDELLVVAATDNKRTFPSRPDEEVRLGQANRDERVMPLKLIEGGAHRLSEVAVVVLRDQVRDYVGVGLRGELAAAIQEALLQ